jgi:hypothetical protein
MSCVRLAVLALLGVSGDANPIPRIREGRARSAFIAFMPAVQPRHVMSEGLVVGL